MEEFEINTYFIGALLVAIGHHMMAHGVCAHAALDGTSDDALVASILEEGAGMSEKEARAMLKVELSDAINFNPEG